MAVTANPSPGNQSPDGGLWASILRTVDGAVDWARQKYVDLTSFDFLRANAATVRMLGTKIDQLRSYAQQQQQRATELGRPDIAADLAARAAWLGELKTFYNGVISNLNWLNTQVAAIGWAPLGEIRRGDELGLSLLVPTSPRGEPIFTTNAPPAIPVALIAAAVLLAGYFVYLMFHTSDQEAAINAVRDVLDKLAAQQITGEQATQAITAIKQTASNPGGVAGSLGEIGKMLPWILGGIALLVVLPNLSRSR